MRRKGFLIACLLFYINCFAQQYPFVHYTPKDGLVNSRVRKAYQDSKGRMYFITYGGLSVYDGARFKNYTVQNGLLSDLVNDVLEVGDDSLLVAVNTSGLNVLVSGKMKKFDTGKSCPIINQFLKTRDGNIYTSTDDGLYELKKNSFEKRSTSYPLLKEPVDFLGTIADYKDFLVFTTNDMRNFSGLFLYNKKTDQITDILLGVMVAGLKNDRNGTIWVGSSDRAYNLDTIALVAGKIKLITPYTALAAHRTFSGGSILFNLRHEPLIAADNEIIRYINDGTKLIISSPEPGRVLMSSFFIDREDILWICNDGNGVYKLSNTKLQSTDKFSRVNNSGILVVKTFNPTSTWMAMGNGQWIASISSKIKLFDIFAKPRSTLIPLQYDKNHLYAVSSNKLYKAPLPGDNETAIHFSPILTLPDTINFGGESIFDPYGNMILFESRNMRVIQNGKQISAQPISPYDLIEGMYLDNKKLLWVVSRGRGLTIFSLHPEDTAHYLQKEFQYINEFETASPRCMTIDKNEILWVGTRYDGLMAFKYTNNQLKKLYHFQTQNGLTDNFVTALACDSNNNIIIGTQTGIDRLINTTDGGYRLENITKSNNIFSYIIYVWTDINNNAYAATNTGGVFQLEPVAVSKIVAEPQLLIEEMKINGNSFSVIQSALRLKYYQHNINFSIAAPTFIDERQVHYSYLLEGSGINKWSDTSTLADINFLNLSPGNYTLHVKAFFFSTSYSPKEIEFPFEILPPWWQTWWFKILAGVLLIALAVLIVRYYYARKLEKQKVLLERKQAIEKERTRIATDMHDDLGAGLSRIKFLSETIGIKKLKKEPIEDEISSIRDYSHEMIDKMGEIVWALNEKNDSLSDLLAYTRSYAVEYLSQNGIHCTVEIPDEFPSAFVSGEFRRNVYLSVKEALHNIVKHARANSVFIGFNIRNALQITIRDDGRGFDKNNIKPYSNGLINMQKRMKELGGSFVIESINGTIIKLSAPLP